MANKKTSKSRTNSKAVKSIPKETTTKRSTRPKKQAGSTKTRKMVREITKRVLDFCANQVPSEAGELLGVEAYDIKNLRAGNQLSLEVMLKIIRNGKFSPESIISGKKLKKLPPHKSIKAVQQKLIDARLRKLARSKPAKEWAKSTGLSVHGLYGLRTRMNHAGIHIVLGFINSGSSIEEVFFGRS